MNKCEGCEDRHVFTMSFSSQSLKTLKRIVDFSTEPTEVKAFLRAIDFDGIVERCDHGELQDCEECDSVQE